MNAPATVGKNVQTATTAKKAREIRAVSPSAPNPEQPVHYISSARRNPLAKYGGRASRYRHLDILKPWQVYDLHVADTNAGRLGVPLNTFITISWGATFDGEAHMPRNFRRGVKRMSQWLRDNGIKVAWLYVHENPGDMRLNSHLLAHVPVSLRKCFCELAPVWFGTMDSGIRVEPRCYPGIRDTRLQYLSKGADDFTCRRYGGRRAKGGQGTINIKRAGVSKLLRPEKPSMRVAT